MNPEKLLEAIRLEARRSAIAFAELEVVARRLVSPEPKQIVINVDASDPVALEQSIMRALNDQRRSFDR